MIQILTPLVSPYSLQIPEDVSALIGWVIGLLVIIGLGIGLRDRPFRMDRPKLNWLAALSVLILVLTPFVGVLPRMSPALGSGEVPIQHLMFFAAIPWMVAGGVLGVLPATLLAGLSGLLLAYLDTQNIFTPLILMSVTVIFSWSVRQRYRSIPFTWLRFPLVAAFASLFLNAPVVFVTLALSAPGTIAGRVYAATLRFPVVMFALSGMVLIGGVVCVIVQAFAQAHWGMEIPLRASPGERHFIYRFLAYSVPAVIIVMAVVFVSTWSTAQNHARKILLSQMTSNTGLAAESLGVFAHTGKQQIKGLVSDPLVVSGSPEDVIPQFDQYLQTNTFYDQLVLLDANGSPIAVVPSSTEWKIPISHDMQWIEDILSEGETPQTFLAATGVDDEIPIVVFFSAVENQPGEIQRVLMGQTVFEENKSAQPFLRAMDDLAKQGGSGKIVDVDGKTLFHTDGIDAAERFSGLSFLTATFYQSITEDGQSLAHYYQPVAGTSWGIAATLPATAMQEMAWQFTYPIVLITAGAMALILLGVWVGFSPLVSEMDSLAATLKAVTVGTDDLSHVLHSKSDKSRRFSAAFHEMVVRQKSRMDKQAELLSVSGRISSQSTVKDSLQIIMASALSYGSSSARLVFSKAAQSAFPDNPEKGFGMGRQTRMLASLDQGVLDLGSGKGIQILRGDDLADKLPGTEMMPDLGSVALIPLTWKDFDLGVFWVAFPDILSKGDEVVLYLKELARMASITIVNAKSFEELQSTQSLMESLINLLPEAILISDPSGKVLFQNRSALDILKVDSRSLARTDLTSLLGAEKFAQLNRQVSISPTGGEIQLKDGRSFNLITSPIQVAPRQSGQVWIFNDMTQQKTEDSIKSELVTTVSHELRSPLTLILGYAKILRLTGNLNEQQDVYISNIIDGVEEMKDLVQKLLDIGRLEGGDPLNFQQFTAEEIMQRVAESMNAQAKQKNIQFAVNLPDYPVLIEGDQTFLALALKNLVENAIKFSKMGGEVTMTIRQDDQRVVFKVEDKGIGIAPLDQRDLFKKFNRTNVQSDTENVGSGLGLAIVKSIAERHGGKVWLESHLGRGSAFFIEIPCKQPQQSQRH